MTDRELITVTVETTPKFKEAWRRLDLMIDESKEMASKGAAVDRAGHRLRETRLKHEVHDLIIVELKHHLRGHEVKLRDVEDYATMAMGALLQFKYWAAESWKEKP